MKTDGWIDQIYALHFQIAHVIREIQLYQQTPYRIEHHRRVCMIMTVLAINSLYILVKFHCHILL